MQGRNKRKRQLQLLKEGKEEGKEELLCQQAILQLQLLKKEKKERKKEALQGNSVKRALQECKKRMKELQF